MNNLCDVFIENTKAILQDGSAEEKRSAQDTLYTALEAALTMIHPYMPYVTEELWQRLPRRPDDKTSSIVLARYPIFESSLENESAAETYELVLGAAEGARSLTATYLIKGGGKRKFDLYCHSYLC